jgi:hypothetical protein
MEQTLGEDAEEAMKALTKKRYPVGCGQEGARDRGAEGTLHDLRVGRCPDAAREGAGERGRAGRRGRKSVGPARPRGLTTIPWWLPGGREVFGTEHFPGRPARESRDPAKRLRGPVPWLWFLRKVRPTHSRSFPKRHLRGAPSEGPLTTQWGRGSPRLRMRLLRGHSPICVPLSPVR